MEILFELVLSAFLVFFIVQTLGLSTKTINGDLITARGFPLVVALLALALMIYLMIKKVRDCKKEGTGVFADIRIPKRLLYIMGALLAYIFILNKLGFVISTIIYMFVNVLLLGYKNKKFAVIFTIVLVAAFTLVFGKLFYVPLPRGVGILKELSYYIY